MIESVIKITKLTASQGHMLTNGQAYGRTVYLGKNDSIENWHEITQTEYDAIMEETAKMEQAVIVEM